LIGFERFGARSGGRILIVAIRIRDEERLRLVEAFQIRQIVDAPVCHRCFRGDVSVSTVGCCDR
jgi:hypothetical protein